MDDSPTRPARRTEQPRATVTADQASRMAVAAVVADLEYWARLTAVDGYVGLNDLVHTLDLIRGASTEFDELTGGESADAA